MFHCYYCFKKTTTRLDAFNNCIIIILTMPMLLVYINPGDITCKKNKICKSVTVKKDMKADKHWINWQTLLIGFNYDLYYYTQDITVLLSISVNLFSMLTSSIFLNFASVADWIAVMKTYLYNLIKHIFT